MTEHICAFFRANKQAISNADGTQERNSCSGHILLCLLSSIRFIHSGCPCMYAQQKLTTVSLHVQDHLVWILCAGTKWVAETWAQILLDIIANLY